MDVNTLIARIAPRLWLIVLLAVLGGVAGFALSRFTTPSFQSEARLLVGQTLDSPRVDYSDLLASQLLAQTYADLAGTSPVLEAAAATLNPPADVAELSRSVAARAPSGSIYVVIAAQAGDGARAAAMANAVATALAARAPTDNAADAELQDAIRRDLTAVDGQVTDTLAEIGRLSGLANPSAADTQQLETLQARLESLRNQRTTLAAAIPGPGSNGLTIVEPASPPTEAFQPRTFVNAALGALIGGGLGLVFVLLLPAASGPVPAARRVPNGGRR